MRDLDKTYTPEYFAVREKDLGWRTPIMAAPLVDVLEPASVVDVACGDGHLVAYLAECGIKAYGIEGTQNCAEALKCSDKTVRICDIRKPFSAASAPYEKADLCTMFNAIDHIEPELLHMAIKNLAQLSDRIVFNAPDYRISEYWQQNVQGPAYWEEKFARQGFVRNPVLEARIKLYWTRWAKKPGIRELYHYLYVMERRQKDGESESES